MAFSPRGGAVISFSVEGADTAQRQIETIGNSFDRMSTVASTGMKVLAAGVAALQIGAYVKDATLLAARYETLGIVMQTVGENAGYSNAQMDVYAKGLEKSGISMMKAREAMISMTTANLDNNKSLELGRLAQNLAVVANKSSSETLTDLITNIQQADTEGLKHMGIILNQDEALQKYATSHGTVAKALTQTQKAEAVQAAVMQQGAKYAGIYEKAMGTAGKALNSLDRYFENIKVRLGTPFLEGFAQGVFGVTDGVKQLNKWLEQLESNGAMEKVAKSIGSSVGAVISVIRETISITGEIADAVVSVGKAAAKFFDDYLGGMATVKAATVGFALLLSGFMVEQAVIGFTAVSAAAWASATKVGAAFLAMGAAATNMFRLLQLSAAVLGWGPAIAIAARTAIAAVGAAVASIPGAVGAAVVAAGLGVGYLFAKAFGDTIQKMVPKSVDDAVTKAMAWVVSKTSSLPEVSEAIERDTPEDVAKAAANKKEKDRKEQLMRDMNGSVVAAEAQVSLVAATTTRLKALNELRDQQLKQSLDQRIITQADYLQKKEKMDVAEAQGQIDQLAAQKAQLSAYMAATAAGAPLGQGRDATADANEMRKLSGDLAAAQTKLNAVKQSYAYQIAGATIEAYTKEFGSITSLVDAQEELNRSTRYAYQEAGKTEEQVQILAATRMQAAADQLSATLEERRANGDATQEYITNTTEMIGALTNLSMARNKSVASNVATRFVSDTKAMHDETVALYDDMARTFIGTDEERIRSAAAASIKLASIRLADANSAIDNTNDSDGQKLDAKRKALADYNKYVQAVYDNADAKVLQSSRGFQTLGAAIEAAFDPNRIESFGQAMSNAFGGAGAALGTLIDTFTLYDQQQKDNEKARATASIEYKNDAGKLAAAQSAITMKQEREQLSYYGNIAGAAKGFFQENSTGYKVMEGVEKAYRAFELAMAIETALRKTGILTTYTAAAIAGKEAETQATIASVVPDVAASVAKGEAAAAAGVAAQAQGDPYTAFGRMAAMAAIMAALGFAVAGGGSGDTTAADRQKAQGTGSILGDTDAKSDSIKKSLDLVEKNTYQGLAISSSMLASLRNIESSVSSFASQLVRSTDIANPSVSLKAGAGTTTLAKADMVATGAEIGLMLGAPFVGALVGVIASKIPAVQKLYTSVFGGKQSVSDSGFSLNASSLQSILADGAKAYQYADITTSGGWFRKDKTSTQSTNLDDAANQQFTAIITSMADSIKAAGSVLGLSGDDFTAKLNSFVIDIGKISLKGLSGDEIQKALESVFSKLGDDMAQFAVGGLQQFQAVGEGYLETLARIASEYQTVDVVFASFGKTFDLVGLSSIEARDRLVQLAGGLEDFTSQGEYFLQNFFSDKEQAAALQKRVDPILAQYGLSSSGEDAMKAFRDLVVSLDTTTEAGAQAYTVLMSVAPALKTITDAGQDVLDQRKDLQDKLDDLTMTSAQLHEKERATIDASNLALYDRVAALQAEKDAVTAAAAALQATKDAASTLLGGVDSMMAVLQKVATREKAAVQTTIDAHTEAVTRFQGLSDALHSALDGYKTDEQVLADRAAAQAEIRADLAITKAGGALSDSQIDSLKKALGVATKDAASQFGSYTDYLRDMYRTQSDIAGLADVTDNSLSIEKQALQAAKDQLTSIDAVLASAQSQVDLLKGVDASGITLVQAMQALTSAMLAAKANPIVGATSAINDAYQKNLGRTPDAEGLEWWQNAAATGTSVSDIVSGIANSTEATLNTLYQQLLGRAPDAQGLAFWGNSYGSTMDAAERADFESAVKGSAEYKTLHPFAVGTNFIPEDMPAYVHKGERIIPAADNRALFAALASPGESSGALLAEIKAMREDNKALREEVQGLRDEARATAGHTEKTSRLLNRVVRQDGLVISTEDA